MALLTDLLNLDLSDSTEKIIAEYIWIGGSGMDLRSKARTLSGPVTDPSKLPKWNYDDSSTDQPPGDDSEVILYPQAIFKDPFRRGKNILVMCDCYTPAGEPIPTNKRHAAAKIFSNPAVSAEEPWYGIEQEYTLLQKDINWPLGWPVGGFPGPQGPYYCSIGADKSFGRYIVDSYYKACLYAGINISGINGEVMPGQWEFQVGPSVGISAGDQVWVARYLLERITEIAGVVVSFDPKPIPGDWNGAGAHTNYSTESMRKDGGFQVIVAAVEKLKLRHKEHIAAYGEGNERRLTGKHETADIHTFSWGVANRGASVRVGRETEQNGKGYFEDRRPASNMDPYGVTRLLGRGPLAVVVLANVEGYAFRYAATVDGSGQTAAAPIAALLATTMGVVGSVVRRRMPRFNSIAAGAGVQQEAGGGEAGPRGAILADDEGLVLLGITRWHEVRFSVMGGALDFYTASVMVVTVLSLIALVWYFFGNRA